MQANNPDKRLTFLEMIIYDNDWLILFDSATAAILFQLFQ